MGQRPQHETNTLNMFGEKLENRFEVIGTGKIFLNRTMTAQALRPTNNK